MLELSLFINSMNPISLVTAKINPDLDGVASAYAYSRLLQKQQQNATEGIFGHPHVEVQYLIDRFQIDDIAYSPSGHFDSFILVDASDVAGMPQVIRPEDVIEVIDHREFHRAKELFPRAKIQIEKVGAAATQIAERYQNANVSIDRNSAILLYGAIYSNTLHLKASVTTQRDQSAIEWLQKQTQIPQGLIHDMFVAKTEAASRSVENVLQSDWKEFILDSKCIGIAQLEVLQLDDFIRDYLDQILKVLDDLKQKHHLQFAFLTAVDLKQDFNIFVTKDEDAQSLLCKILGVEFKNSVGKRVGLLLRKELVTLILKERATLD